MTGSLRVNIGCGQTPTADWLNFDGSPSVRLARLPRLFRRLICSSGLLLEDNKKFIEFASVHEIKYANALQLPLRDESVETLYSSHMLEHLDQNEAANFLSEAWRVLKQGGILRLVVPDLARIVARYNQQQDADELMWALHVCEPRPKGWKTALRQVVAPGYSRHLWMYDSTSITQLLGKHCFKSITICEPGETTIANPGPLDLREREGESLYVEAKK